MAKGDTSPKPLQAKAGSDVYTVLVIIATLFVTLGAAFLIYRSMTLFDQWLPMGAGG